MSKGVLRDRRTEAKDERTARLRHNGEVRSAFSAVGRGPKSSEPSPLSPRATDPDRIAYALADVLAEEGGKRRSAALERACRELVKLRARTPETDGEELVAARLYDEHEAELLALVDRYEAKAEAARARPVRKSRRAQKNDASPFAFPSANRRR